MTGMNQEDNALEVLWVHIHCLKAIEQIEKNFSTEWSIY